MTYSDPIKRREYAIRYARDNAAKARERAKKWRQDNPERTAANVAKWNAIRARPRKLKTPAEQLERKRKWSRESAKRMRAQNPERARERNRHNKLIHRAYYTERQNFRKAQQLKAVPAWANIKAIRKMYQQARLQDKTVDHIVPLISPYVCGLHCEDNLQLLSGEENSKKSNRHWPDMFPQHLSI